MTLTTLRRMSETTSASFVQRAREMNERRLSAIEPLVEAHLHVQTLLQELESAEERRRGLRKDAQDAGWTAKELKDVGLPDDLLPAPSRPRRRTATKPRTTSATPSTQPAAENTSASADPATSNHAS